MALNTTPEERMVDARGRPYFLWDSEMTLVEFRKQLAHPDPRVSGYMHAKLMRQARPDDVFVFTTPGRIRELWPNIEKHLGRSLEFWQWIFSKWEHDGRGWL